MLGMISTAKHNRIVAEKDAEIAGLMKRIQVIHDTQLIDMKRIRNLKDRCNDLYQQMHDYRARLAPFTTPRARDDKGRFIKDYAR